MCFLLLNLFNQSCGFSRWGQDAKTGENHKFCISHASRAIFKFRMYFVEYTSHTQDIVVLSAFCASLPMKRYQKFAFASSSSHGWFDVVERWKWRFEREWERTRVFDFFGKYLLLRYKAIGLLKNFGEKCQNSRFTANK